MGIEILLGTGVSHGGLVHLSSGDIEGCNEGLGAMANIFKLDEVQRPGFMAMSGIVRSRA